MIIRGKPKIVLKNKITLKKFSKVVINSLLLGYIGFSLISLSACSKKGEESFFDELLRERNETAETLLHEFDAQMFPCKLEEIFRRPVVLDSVIISIIKNKEDYFIRARINANCDKKYYADLKCCSEIVGQFNKTKSNYAFIAAKITKVDNYNLVAEADSLEGAKSQFILGDAILLTGECLALAEVPPIINTQ